MTAADLFVGYLLLDAWIGNTDRHDENWGLLVTPPRKIELAPTFDHASSLGRELSDELRQRRLNTRDERQSVQTYAMRARSGLFRAPNDKQPLSTLEAFRAAAQLRPRAAAFWRERLSVADWHHVELIFREIPGSEMTPIAVNFALRVLAVNRKRILEMGNQR